MKKLLVIALALCMMLTLVACGGEEKKENSKEESKVESTVESKEESKEESKAESAVESTVESAVESTVESAVEESSAEESSAEEISFDAITSDEDTNYALNATYEILKNGVVDTPEATFLAGWEDTELKLLNDGKVAEGSEMDPNAALAGTTVQLVGTNALFDVVFTLDNYYADFSKIVFRNVRNGEAGNNNRGFDRDIFPMVYVSVDGINWTLVTGSCDEGVQVEGAPEIKSMDDETILNIESFDYTYTLDAAQTAKYVKVSISTPVYVLQLDEIELWN